MGFRDVRGSDYSDAWINSFFDSVRSLRLTLSGPLDGSLRKIAERFAKSKPRPNPDDFRHFVDQAVAVARGWDHPYDHDVMLDAAVKSFYLLAWLEYFQKASSQMGNRLDIRDAFAVNFTPVVAKSDKK